MLTITARNRAVALAHEQWNDFLEYSELPQSDTRHLLDRAAHDHPNQHITRFLEYAAQLRGAVQGTVTLDSLATSDCHSKAVSWLARVPSRDGSVSVSLKLDFARLRGSEQAEVRGASVQQTGRIVRALCLHEIGHLYLHWEHILEGRVHNARWAKPLQEAEAWCFAFSLLSMAAESFAEDFFTDPDNRDHVWELMRDNLL